MNKFLAATAAAVALTWATQSPADEALAFRGAVTLDSGLVTVGDVPVSATNPLPVAASGAAANGATANPNPVVIGGRDASTGAINAFKADSTGAFVVQGTAVSGGSDNGNPVKVGGVYSTTLPTFSDGQRGDLQIGSKGSVHVELFTHDSGNALGATDGASDGVNPASVGNVLGVSNFARLFNGATWDRWLATNALGSAGNSQGVAAVANAPTGSQGQAIAPTATSAVGSNLVVKAAAGNLYRWTVTTGASGGYVLVFDATSAPADGAVTPKQCVAVPANATVRDNNGDFAERYVSGITIVFSTTGCFRKTASATAFIQALAL